MIDYEHVVANGTISLKDVIKDIHQKLENVSTQNSNWKGKKCAFIGDSITQGVGTTKAYHSYLQESLGIVSYNYGINGAMMSDMYNQIVRVREEHPDIDVIFIFGGTNDYNANIPIGTFYTESVQTVNVNGTQVSRKFRNIETNDISTFCNRLNKLLSYARQNFPKAKIILMTPIHRGYATFGTTNVQQNELYSNSLDLYIDDYVNAVIEASNIWSCSLINLFRDSGLYPVYENYAEYFANKDRDMLHPNAKGHKKIADVIEGETNRIKL